MVKTKKDLYKKLDELALNLLHLSAETKALRNSLEREHDKHTLKEMKTILNDFKAMKLLKEWKNEV